MKNKNNIRKSLRQIKDCKERKRLLQCNAGSFTVECRSPKATDPKCVLCEFNRTGQMILDFVGEDSCEREQDSVSG